MSIKILIPAICLALLIQSSWTKKFPSPKDNKYRPQFHFSIAENWINDPNGMVYLDGEYHLHYQYYPDGTTWGPMHWGHSVSSDLVKWTELPISLYPDELGDIFSGSAVADFGNTTGFQTGSNTPIVAIFTHAGASQQQSIAFSNDKGRTFTKYSGNPVIPNPGMPDFRDPKVIRYRDSFWVQVLAAGNKVMFYKSFDLKSWEFLSEFGNEPSQGSHSGVWECPDFLEMTYANENVWVLLVSINPGGPNGGSATQYFVGDFDGNKFTSPQINPLWMDWGVDNYASVSFFNDPLKRHIVMGWMNNWDYANNLPTNGWRGQMTLPRVLELQLADGQLRLKSFPAEEVDTNLVDNGLDLISKSIAVNEIYVLPTDEVFSPNNSLMKVSLTFDTAKMAEGASLAICFTNTLKQELCTGLDKGRNHSIFLNRELSGLTDFNPGFSRRADAAREISTDSVRFDIYLDVSAIELFVDSGLTCMTMIFYPDEPYTKAEIRHHSSNENSSLDLTSGFINQMKSIF